MGTVAARGETTYTFVAPTLQDSSAAGNPYTDFMVDAHGAFAPGFWDSPPDSGYSVDNLSPLFPSPFTGVYSAGATALHWGRNTEPDFALYRLFRGTTLSFVPAAGNLVATRPDTGYVDPAGAPYFYKLSAVDVHGNESGFATAQPSGTTDAAGAGLPRELWLARAAPNPARDGAVLRFGLPRDAHASLALFDQQGRLVRVLLHGTLESGEHAARWDGRDGAGHEVPSGLYFVRLEAAGRVLTTRLAAIY